MTFIYSRFGQIKALGLEDAKAFEASRLSEGWVHTTTVCSNTILEKIVNNPNDRAKEILKLMK